MKDAPYTVLCEFKSKPGAIRQMKDLSAGLLAPSRAEDGCIDYYWYQSLEDASKFVLYMNWRDQAAFEAHVRSSHVRAAEKALEELLSEPYSDSFWKSLG